MSKLSVFAISFSVILITLFATLVYLMTIINPPEQVTGDVNPNGTATTAGRFDDTDYYLNSNEALLSNDKYLRYGLERVTGEHDILDAYGKIFTKLKSGQNNTDIPDLLFKNETQENCTRIRMSEIEQVTQPVKPAKDLRRSINEKEFLENVEDIPISLLMKIKRLDGEPGIQIKLISDNVLKNQRLSKYKTSGIVTTSNYSSKINFEFDSVNNSIRAASIVLAENGILNLNIFANAIDVIRDNNTMFYKFGDNNKGNQSDANELNVFDTTSSNIYYESDPTFINNSTHLNWQTETESVISDTASTNVYTYNILNNNFTDVNISMTQNSLNKTFGTEFSANDKNNYAINTYASQQETSEGILGEENEITTQKLQDGSLSITDSETESTVVTENQDKVFVSDESKNITNLVGLLIPESTANLPTN